MKNESKREFQRPEGRLIERAMAGPPKISGRKLGEMSTLSEGRIRQIVNGYRSEAGMNLPVVAPAETLARLGQALKLSPAQFDEAGRPDAAEIMRGDVTSGVTEEGHLWLEDDTPVRDALAEWLSADLPGSPPVEALMLWEMDELLDAASRKHASELQFARSLAVMLHVNRGEGGDGHAEESRGPAPTSRDDFTLATHDDEKKAINDENELGTDHP